MNLGCEVVQNAKSCHSGSDIHESPSARAKQMVMPHNHNDSDAKKRNKVVDRDGVAMGINDCTMTELYCLERSKLEPLNRGKWIAQAERWHELGRAQKAWRLQKKPLQQSMHVGPMATQADVTNGSEQQQS